MSTKAHISLVTYKKNMQFFCFQGNYLWRFRQQILKWVILSFAYFAGNKAKGRISKRVLLENKIRQIFRKTNISYPLIRTPTCAYQGVKNVCFWKICCALFSCNTRFEISPFAQLPTNFEKKKRKKKFACLAFFISNGRQQLFNI